MSEEWGPWIKHDGSGCPCVGLYVEIYNYDKGILWEGVAGSEFDGTEHITGSSWHWYGPWLYAHEYRIRKPKGMKVLEGILKEVGDKPPPVSPPSERVPGGVTAS